MRKPTPTGTGGKGGTTGAAGTGAAGTMGAAGTGAAGTGAAGDGAAGTGIAGTMGAAGTGAAGTGAAGDGTAGTAPPPPPPCDSMPKKALPYAIGADFKSIVILNGANNMQAWKIIENPECDTTNFPPLNPPPDGGVDGGDGGTGDAAADGGAGSDGGVDAADDTLTLQLDEDGGTDAADAPKADAAADAATDAGASDAPKTDGGDAAAPAIPACYEFTFNPDPCVAANGSCWGGVIFAPTTALGSAAPGICIEAGATKIEFWARSNREGALIKWGAIGPGVGSNEFYIPITTTWTKYTMTSPATTGIDYNGTSDTGGVWNGFSVVGDPDPHAGGTYIFLKDIKWLK